MTTHGYIQNCFFISREGGPQALTTLLNGNLLLQLNNYAILPREQYQALTAAFNTDANDMLANTLVKKPGKPKQHWAVTTSMILLYLSGLFTGLFIWAIWSVK